MRPSRPRRQEVLVDEHVGLGEAKPRVIIDTLAHRPLQQRDDACRIAEHGAAHDRGAGRRSGNHATALLQLANRKQQRRLDTARPQRVHDAGLVAAREKHAVGGADFLDQHRIAHRALVVDALQLGSHRQVLSHRTVRDERGDRALRGCQRITRRGRQHHEARTTPTGQFDQSRPDGCVVVAQRTADGYGRTHRCLSGGDRRLARRVSGGVATRMRDQGKRQRESSRSQLEREAAEIASSEHQPIDPVAPGYATSSSRPVSTS